VDAVSITNYGELKTAVANWLNRGDLTDYIPDFIAMGEGYINRDLRVRNMLARVTAQTVGASAYIDLPTDFVEMRNIQLNVSDKYPLSYMSPEVMDSKYLSQTGQPKFYTILGDELQFAPIPDSTYTVEIAYFQSFPAQSSDTDSSWLHTNAKDLLLYSALIAAEPFLKNDSRIALWQAMYQAGIDQLNRMDKKARVSGSSLMTHAG
jgi:hypothetical protein